MTGQTSYGLETLRSQMIKVNGQVSESLVSFNDKDLSVHIYHVGRSLIWFWSDDVSAQLATKINQQTSHCLKSQNK